MDPRNAQLWVHVGGELVPRDRAKVSVFDSSVQGGDAVWEGLRVYAGRVFELDAHLDRLEASARALAVASIRVAPRSSPRSSRRSRRTGCATELTSGSR